MSVANNPYPAAHAGVDPAILRNIRLASQSTATDFGLLMAQAAQESSFNPDAKAASGSAAGLFQFNDSTWLDMMQRYGAKHGAGALASEITTDAAGKPHVADPAAKHRILALRSDPQLSASLAGEYAKQNQAEVEHALGHPVGRAAVYMAHFLGAGGATTFLKALDSKGATAAASLLPDAAASNPTIFYDGETGRARSVAEIFRTLGNRIEQEAARFDSAGAPASAPEELALAAPSPVPLAQPAAPATPAAAAYSPGPARAALDGLRVTQPVAALLDTLTLAALKLVGKS